MSSKKKTTKNAANSANAAVAAKCAQNPKRAEACQCQAAEARKIDLGKVTEAVKKVPQWLVRVQSELKQLIDRLNKLDAMIEKLKKLLDDKTATKLDKENYRLLSKQRKAMASYRDVLIERVSKANVQNA